MKDKYELRFDSSGAVSAGMFDEEWRRFVIKMATGSGKTKVMSLILAWCYFHKLYDFIVETKGQEDLDVPLKMARLKQWCADINREQKEKTFDFVFVDEENFQKFKPSSFGQLARIFSQHKG